MKIEDYKRFLLECLQLILSWGDLEFENNERSVCHESKVKVLKHAAFVTISFCKHFTITLLHLIYASFNSVVD